MFVKVDSDGSGSVDVIELVLMLLYVGQFGDSVELLKKMDSDGNGSLFSDELSQGLCDLMLLLLLMMDFVQFCGVVNDDGDGDWDVFVFLDIDGDGQFLCVEFEVGWLQLFQGVGGLLLVQVGGGRSGIGVMFVLFFVSVDLLDINKDGMVLEIECLVGQLKEFVKVGLDSMVQGLSLEIVVLVQKFYDQISWNWLQFVLIVQVGQVDVSV